MEACAKRLRVPAISLLLAALVLLPSHVSVRAGNPRGAYYSPETDKVFWFLHVSDLHIGASGSADSDRLRWLLGDARNIIDPEFIVATGDITDSTDGNILGYPNGPYQTEWDEYNSILAETHVGADFFYDLPGNHEAYNDRDFSYYLANSVQGLATGSTQLSWTRQFSFGTYHFLGVNTAGNNGAAFSLFRPYGDYAGLDSAELAFINQQLDSNANAQLTLVFGHHPVTNTGVSTDTWLGYGHQEFIHYLDLFAASTYNYGHTHRSSQALFTGNSYTGSMSGGGIHYYNVASLSQDEGTGYSLVAIDCNGLSSITKSVGAWPVVLITAPLDRYLGGSVNPYAYTVPAAAGNPIRALVFDKGIISQVQFRIDGADTWYTMNPVDANPALWQGTWDASALAGEHSIEVRAIGSTTVSDTLRVEVYGNHAPVAGNDAYAAYSGQALNVPTPGVLANDSDPDGNLLTAAWLSGPDHGQLSFSSSGSFAYTASTGYIGGDSFTYAASDGKLSSNTATVSITVTSPDVITSLSATYNMRKKQLTVQATSSAQPNVTLTVEGLGPMTYKPKLKAYVLAVPVTSKPSSVTVISSGGARATASVN
jgi:3',5'-cyclic AMP phosphodiesterase CpdA